MAQRNAPIPLGSAGSYFQRLSSDYSRQTGDSTFNLAETFWSSMSNEINELSIVHDNGCGVGTASLALLSAGLPQPRQINATDNSEAMINVLTQAVQEKKLDFIKPALMDSLALTFQDGTFDVSITNISITNFSDPPKALKEVHRTLKGGGLAVVSIWKLFTVAEIIHKAQRRIRPDAELMRMPKPEFTHEGYLKIRAIEAGFTDVEQHVVETVVKGDAVEGLVSFMLGPFTKTARAGWTDEEQTQWPTVIYEVVAEEVARNGGIPMSAWFITGRK